MSDEKSRTNRSAVAGDAAATVASVRPPRATSSAMLAPISTAVSTPSTRSIIAEMSCGPSGRTRIPLISERATVFCELPPAVSLTLTAPTKPRTMRPACWCGAQISSTSAPFTELARSGSARTLGPSLTPGRYLTFSFSSLITSESFLVVVVVVVVFVGVLLPLPLPLPLPPEEEEEEEEPEGRGNSISSSWTHMVSSSSNSGSFCRLFCFVR